MFHRKLSVFCMLVLAALASATVLAQPPSSAAEQQKLQAFEQQLQQLKTEQQQYAAELKQAKTALTSLQNQSSPEEAELEQAREALQQAQATYESEPTEENQARLKNEEFKHALAERKFKKANADLYELQDKVDSLTQLLNQTASKINGLTTTISNQKAAVETARAREAAARQAQLAEEQRLKAEAAQAEIERLKAQLAEQKRLEKARQAEAAEAAAAAEAARAAAASAPASPTPVAKAEAKPEMDRKSGGAILLSTKEEVRKELQRLDTLLATPHKGKRQYNKILNVKRIRPNGEAGRAKANRLDALGHNQYKGKAMLPAGPVMLSIGFNRWRETIPKAASAEYTVIFDSSNPRNPRLLYYPQTLETAGK